MFLVRSHREMNAATKAAILIPQSYCSRLKTAFFHFTPVLERKRSSSNSNSNSKSNTRKKKSKKFLREHQETIRRALEEVKREQEKIKREKEEIKRAKEEASKARESKQNRNDKYDFQNWHKSNFNFYIRDFDYVLRTLFGKSQGFTYSFNLEEEDRRWWRHSSSDFNNSRNSWRSKYRFYNEEEEEEDGYTSTESREFVIDSVQASHRQTLGMSPWGPLNLEDVKHAYRTCALKWHPDRHDESTKAAAEEKFKLCTVAYQYLMEKLPVN